VEGLRLIAVSTFWARARGLLGRPPLAANEALLLRPCRAVHTFFMRYPIDVVFLDRVGNVVAVREALRPWRVAFAPRARAALELLPMQARRFGLRPGSAREELSS
jgi:uncharacterized protein